MTQPDAAYPEHRIKAMSYRQRLTKSVSEIERHRVNDV